MGEKKSQEPRGKSVLSMNGTSILSVAILCLAGFLLWPIIATQFSSSCGCRAPDSDTKANLHNVFLACKAYWADSGSANACNADIYNLTTYGYIQSSKVVVAVKVGDEQNFRAIAMHQNSKKAYEEDALGAISQYYGPIENDSGGVVAKEPEEPSIFSKSWKALTGIFRY